MPQINWQKKYKKIQEDHKDFVSFISHELRSPLTVTKGYLAMVLEGAFGKFDKKGKEVLSKTYANNEKAIRLVGNVVEAIRFDEGELNFQRKKIDLTAVVRKVVSDYQLTARNLGGSVRLKQPVPQVELGKADEDKIEHVISNIIGRIISREGGGTIKVVLQKRAKECFLKIINQSHTLANQDLMKIKSNFRGDHHNKDRRAIAWYVSYKLIKAHGGVITLGRGSNQWWVQIRLPLSS